MTKAQPLPAKADKPKAASLRTFVSAFNIESKIIIPITIIVSLYSMNMKNTFIM